jgi:hypothetical protein
VGNGADALLHKKGKLIDRHDIVVRFNNYHLPLALMPQVGRKSDVWAVNPGIANDDQFRGIRTPRRNRPRTTLILSPWRTTRHGAIYPQISRWALEQGWSVNSESSALRAHGFFGADTWPSSGALALSYFAELDCPVSLIGFSSGTGKDGYVHYTGKELVVPHDMGLEKQWREQFVAFGFARYL